MAQDPSILAGTPYRLLRKIGEGASGEVFEAEHVELGRRYAVKVLSSAHAAAHDAVERFRREARAVAKLSHPNLVQLHDFGKSVDGRVFLAMELLEGQTLDMHAEKGIGWREAIHLAVQATRALEAAHAAGVVHRDLKPQNLFLTSEGDLKLLDFGVAMALAETGQAAERKQKGFAVFGTPEYMAPEQVAGETVDARCDVYALGCVLYELVTGTRPFEGSPVVVMGKQLREEPERPRTRAPHALIPGELEAVVLRALAKAKDDRFATAKDMREALEEALVAPGRRRSHARKIATVALLAATCVIAAAGLKGRVTSGTFKLSGFSGLSESGATAVTEPPVPTATMAATDLPPAPTPPPAAPAEPNANAEPNAPAPAPASASASASASAPASAPASALADRREIHTRHPNPLLVRASARTGAIEEERAHLAEARSAAHERSTDPKALKAWATAALHAGEMREARRAAEAWAVHDRSAEPRMFLAAALEATGRKREARAVLEEWLANHPDSHEAKRMLSRLGGTPEPAIKRSSRGRSGRLHLHPPDPVADGE
jgi:serine/threonine-protein kinase